MAMTQEEQLELLKSKIAATSQAVVARALGYSPSAISQAMSGSYKGDLGNMLRKVEEVFSGSTVICPVLGEISLAKCAENRRRDFAATNPLRVQLYRTCRSCKNGGK